MNSKQSKLNASQIETKRRGNWFQLDVSTPQFDKVEFQETQQSRFVNFQMSFSNQASDYYESNEMPKTKYSKLKRHTNRSVGPPARNKNHTGKHAFESMAEVANNMGLHVRNKKPSNPQGSQALTQVLRMNPSTLSIFAEPWEMTNK